MSTKALLLAARKQATAVSVELESLRWKIQSITQMLDAAADTTKTDSSYEKLIVRADAFADVGTAIQHALARLEDAKSQLGAPATVGGAAYAAKVAYRKPKKKINRRY